MAVTKLVNLLIEEVSVVDSPANELDGWQVMKAKRERTLGDAIRDTYGIDKARHDTRDAIGRFSSAQQSAPPADEGAVAPGSEAAAPSSSLWRHSGNVHPTLQQHS